MNSSSRPYGEEVIGKNVLVRFPVEHGKFAWFPGHVKERKDDEHLIAFEHSETDEWCNLNEWETNHELHWIYSSNDVEKEIIKDAIGRFVLIEFPIQEEKKAWFQATVMRKKTRAKKGKKMVQHLIVYDDGGVKEWLDLWKCIKIGKLQFLGNPVVKADLKNRVATKEAEEVNPLKRQRGDPILPLPVASSPAPPVDQRKPNKRQKEAEEVNVLKRNRSDPIIPLPAVSSPTPPAHQRKQRNMKEAQLQADWTRGMEQWLRQTWHDKEQIPYIMARVRMLASGTGLRCSSWDADRCAFFGIHVNLSCHLPRLLEHAKSFRQEFGMDPDGTLDLMVPLEQMLCYKKSLLDDSDEWNV